MANTQAICNSFKFECQTALHALGTTVTRGATTADTVKSALYLASATLNASTTAYSATGEVSGTGYTAGGVTITNATAPSLSGSTGIWTPSASIAYVGVTLTTTFDTFLVYNSSQANRSIGVYTFGPTTVTGNFTITMPANAAATALLQLA